MLKKYFLVVFLLLTTTCADAIHWDFQNILGPQKLLIGSEGFWVKRSRDGGTKQHGILYGMFIEYDRVKPNGIYWGVEGYWSKGELDGSNGSGFNTRSINTDAEIEGKLGWTFGICNNRILFTPYGGYGYFYGKSDFREPSTRDLTFRDEIEYYTAGIRTRYCISPRTSIGLNFAVKRMACGTSKVTSDPFNDDVSLIIGEKDFYTVEMPITYKFCKKDCMLESYFSPFYRFRKYGFAENFPSDFPETRYSIYGLKIAFNLVI